ncbi:MAG: patatin-like phospholipase family protein [Desulfobulbaceae bacterium]
MNRADYSFSCSVREENNRGISSLIFFVVTALALYAWIFLVPAEAADQVNPERPKIGLVLGGGGAKGSAHIGVLKVLEELRIPVDYITGTSMGAIVGSLYASGLSPAKIEEILTTVDWDDLFSGDPNRQDIDFWRKREDFLYLTPLQLGVRGTKIVLPKGLVKDQKINVLFETIMLHTESITDFDQLPIPFRAVASDVETGEMVVMKSGHLADAARASMSVPGAFPPVELDGRLLIDGGIVRNVPVDIVREMGAEVVICVDVSKPMLKREQLEDPIAIMNQMLDIMMRKNVQEQIATLGPEDVYINPDLGDLESGDFNRGAEGCRMGEEAARKSIDSLRRYSVQDADYAAFLAKQRRETVEEVKIASVQVEVEGKSKISNEGVEDRLNVQAGDTVDIETLKKEAGYVYGMGDFERVDMQVRRQENGYDLAVRARENSIGPNYLRMGLALESNIDATSRYNILINYTRRWMNRLGAEWKTLVDIGSPFGVYTEWYQPLTPTRFYYVMPHAKASKKPVVLYRDSDKIAEYSITEYNAGLDVGIQPWMYGAAHIGLLFGRNEATLETGEYQLPDDSFARAGITYGGALDQLDNLNFPNDGYYAQLKGFSSLDELGADARYDKIEGRVIGAYTLKRQTLLASLQAGAPLGEDLPFYDKMELGGFLNLSGLQHNQIRGQYMSLAKLISYHKVAESFFGDLYLGGSLETGNVWEDKIDFGDLRLAGSVFIGYDTIIGPLYIAAGLTEGEDVAGYFYLGRTF